MKVFEVNVGGDEFSTPDFYPTVVSMRKELKAKFFWMLDKGRPITTEEWDTVPEFYSVQDGKPDTILANGAGWLIFSDDAIELFRQHRITGIQILPVKVFLSDGRRLENYNHVVNLTELVPCFDLERSKYLVFDDSWPDRKGEVSLLMKAVLIKDRIPAFDLFRVKEYKQTIIASERFVKLYKKMKYTGLSFKKLELS